MHDNVVFNTTFNGWHQFPLRFYLLNRIYKRVNLHKNVRSIYNAHNIFVRGFYKCSYRYFGEELYRMLKGNFTASKLVIVGRYRDTQFVSREISCKVMPPGKSHRVGDVVGLEATTRVFKLDHSASWIRAYVEAKRSTFHRDDFLRNGKKDVGTSNEFRWKTRRFPYRRPVGQLKGSLHPEYPRPSNAKVGLSRCQRVCFIVECTCVVFVPFPSLRNARYATT